jgi:hypothetical protein
MYGFSDDVREQADKLRKALQYLLECGPLTDNKLIETNRISGGYLDEDIKGVLAIHGEMDVKEMVDFKNEYERRALAELIIKFIKSLEKEAEEIEAKESSLTPEKMRQIVKGYQEAVDYLRKCRDFVYEDCVKVIRLAFSQDVFMNFSLEGDWPKQIWQGLVEEPNNPHSREKGHAQLRERLLQQLVEWQTRLGDLKNQKKRWQFWK